MSSRYFTKVQNKSDAHEKKKKERKMTHCNLTPLLYQVLLHILQSHQSTLPAGEAEHSHWSEALDNIFINHVPKKVLSEENTDIMPAQA